MGAATGVRILGGVDFRNNLFLSRRRRGRPHSLIAPTIFKDFASPKPVPDSGVSWRRSSQSF
jgi:hypothetical protein